jgi:hypothetical protein
MPAFSLSHLIRQLIMENDTINKRLRDLYQSKQASLTEIQEANKSGKTFEGPHLIHCWEDAYAKAKYKILFVGQEVNGTKIGDVTDDIDDALDWVKGFELGTKYGKAFWNTVHYINREVNQTNDDDLCYLWSNVSKYAYYEAPIGRRGVALSMADFEWINNRFNVLEEEVKIVNPDVVIFLSGPNYDCEIEAQTGSGLVFNQLTKSIPSRQLARITNTKWNAKTYRTYHPNYYERGFCANYVELIIADILDCNIDDCIKQLCDSAKRITNNNSSLECKINENLGGYSNGIYYSKPHWKNCEIGFEFDHNGFGKFFYSICKKDNSIPIPAEIIEKINSHLANEGFKSSKNWACWKWFDESGNTFNHRAFTSANIASIAETIRKEVAVLEKVLDEVFK